MTQKTNVTDLKDRIQGSLIGGAVGDALGFPVEFSDDYIIFGKYGENGITEYSLSDGKALISDDTQMTLFTADGLLRAVSKYHSPSLEQYARCIYESYLNWLSTQNSDYKLKDNISRSPLLQYKELHESRAPGNTCITALESGYCGSFELHLNNSKGCGGVMRVAPIALFLASGGGIGTEEADILAARAAAITHGHPLGYIPAAFLSHLIGSLIKGRDLLSSVTEAQQTVCKLFDKSEELEYFTDLISRAVELSEEEDIFDDLDAIRELGEGWVAEETVAIAVYCSLKHQNSFEEALIASVNHSGDSDSTGAVTGNIMGALKGYKAIPQKYLDNLELKEVILGLAENLYRMRP